MFGLIRFLAGHLAAAAWVDAVQHQSPPMFVFEVKTVYSDHKHSQIKGVTGHRPSELTVTGHECFHAPQGFLNFFVCCGIGAADIAIASQAEGIARYNCHVLLL